MRIKELRLERNLTQSDVAKAIGTSQRNIGRWENGENEPAAFYIKALAEYFNVSADYLLGLEDDFGVKTVAPEQSEEFTASEREMIRKIRAMRKESRELVEQMIDTLAGTDKGSSKKQA